MPFSLRFVLFMSGLATVAATASIVVLFGHDAAQARMTADDRRGRVAAGKTAIGRYGCGSFHRIPGISGANGVVGPSLSEPGYRAQRARVLVNDPETMKRWLRNPQGVVPGNGMPDQGVTDSEARDMTALIYTVRR